MPCYSRIQVNLTTQMNGLDKVEEAAKAAGFKVHRYESGVAVYSERAMVEFVVDGDKITASSTYREADVKDVVAQVGRKYAEARLRQFAQRRGYTISKQQQTVQVGR